MRRGVLDHALLDQHFERSARDGAGERIAAEGRAVLAGLQHAQHLGVREHGRHRIEAARQRLADQRHVGLDPLVLLGQQLARAAEPGLDLVEDQRDALLRCRARGPCAKYPAGGMMTPASPWIGSTRKATVLGVIAAASASESPNGTMRKPGGNGPKPPRASGIGGEADDGDGAAVEVVGADDDLGLVLRHAPHLVAPFANGLDRGLDGLGAASSSAGSCARRSSPRAPRRSSASWSLRKAREVSVSLPACSTIAARIFGMAVALVDGRVGGEAVEIAVAVDVPHPDAAAAAQHHVERLVVVRAKPPLAFVNWL